MNFEPLSNIVHGTALSPEQCMMTIIILIVTLTIGFTVLALGWFLCLKNHERDEHEDISD
jgi:hypothetical protein